MYYQYFGLDRNPFSTTPDPSFLYLTEKHREAIAALLFAVADRKGFLVLTGDAGTGKTTLLRRMMESIPSDKTHFSLVLNPTLTPAEFLEMVLMDFGMEGIPDSKSQRLMRLQQFLLRAHSEGKTCVLIVDEAQKLSTELLEEIRLLTNLETADHKLLQIILAGQPELSDFLNRDELRQLKQRIVVRVSIGPLASQDVGEYIRTRWAHACKASSEFPFSASAIRLIESYSRCIPRVINAICDNALLNAFGSEVKVVEASHIVEVANDLHLVPSTNGNGLRPARSHSNGVAASVSAPSDLPEIQKPLPVGLMPRPLVISQEEFTPVHFKSLERYMPAPAKVPRWRFRRA